MLATALSAAARLSSGAETQRNTLGGERSKVFYGINEYPVWNFKDHELSKFAAMLEQTGSGAVRIPLRCRVMEPGVERVFWFLLRDMKKDLLGPEGSMGLFSYQGKPKPALQAFRNFRKLRRLKTHLLHQVAASCNIHQ